jgi:minor extracellular serine protease Vpr
MKRLSGALLVAVALLLTLAATGAMAGGGTVTDGAAPGATVDTGSALVELKLDPLSTSAGTKPAKGKKIDFSSSAVKSYRAQLNNQRNEFKQWLQANAPKAKVTGEVDISLNAVAVKLNGESLQRIAAAPMVKAAQFEGVYRPLIDDPDLALVHAVQAWGIGAGTAAAKGDGVKVAIVDSGIDITHPCFSDAGYPAQAQSGGQKFTNNKVIFAGVFNNKSGSQNHTPAPINTHGTHVAGTVACNESTPAVLDGVTIDYNPSGVAPRALLGNFNVFPGDDGDARSEDIVNALDKAYELGFSVANMSLGGGSQGFDDLLARATDNLDRANMVVAVAAGNSGPGFSTIESPGKAARALTAGAYTVGHFIATPITAGGTTFNGASGDFATVKVAPLTANLAVVKSGTLVNGISNACAALPAGSLTGKIALVSRGTCVFSLKIRNAQDAGAVATIVANNVAGDPIAMGLGGIPNEPTIPAYMVSMADGQGLLAKDGLATTISNVRDYFLSGNHNFMAGFSSMGPTDVDFRVKPDVVAPGVNVLSAQPAASCATPPCWAFFQGTSMATPHLAGMAAVVRSQHPGWDAAEVRSAIVNTADQGVQLNSNGVGTATSVNTVGAGGANAASAVVAKVALDPVSVSFGAVPSGSGQTVSKTITLSTLSGTGAYTATVANQTGNGVTFSATVSGNTVTVTMTAGKGIAAGPRQGILRITRGGAEVAHAAVFAFIK